MIKKWEFYNSDEKLVDEICEKYNLNKVIGKIIVNRHVVNDEDVRIFITPTRDDFHDPFLFKGMDIAVERIIKAINNKEKILIYGDYDVDGITSTTVLKKYLMDRGISVDTYIPNRLHEGYGLNKNAIDTIKERNIDLIITVDCGISAIEEVDHAVSLGMDVIVTDHHEVGEKLPNALAVIDERAAVLFIDGNRVHRAGAHAGAARIGDGVIRARLGAHAALAALIRVDDRALMGHGNRAETAGLQTALGHTVLAVAGDGIALQGAALARAVHDGNGFVGKGIVVFAVIDGRAAAGPIHAVAQHLALTVDAAAIRGLASVRHDFQRNKFLMGFQRAFKAILGDMHEHLALTVNTLDHMFPP
mgnify:CR=1 FL=1